MKKLTKINILFFGLVINVSTVLPDIKAVPSTQMSGPLIIETTPVPGRIETSYIMYVVDSAAYAPGGITFTYPVGAFSVAPFMVVQAVVPTAVPFTTFVAMVSGNSATGATVTVYKIVDTSSGSGQPTSMLEATLSDNVTVYLYAAGA